MNMKTSTRKNLSGGINMGLRIQPRPEDLIWDATATPADVKSGKVFYNNDGRQVGNAQIAEIMHITLSKDINLGSIGNWRSAVLEDQEGNDYIEYNRNKEAIWSNESGSYSLSMSIPNCMYDQSGINKYLAGFSVDNGSFQAIGYYPSKYEAAHFEIMNNYTVNLLYNGLKVNRVTVGSWDLPEEDHMLHLYFV